MADVYMSQECEMLDHKKCRNYRSCRCDCHDGGTHDRAKLPDKPPPDRLLVEAGVP